MARGYIQGAEDHKDQGTQIPRHDYWFPDSSRALGDHGRLPKRGYGGFPRSPNIKKNEPGIQSYVSSYAWLQADATKLGTGNIIPPHGDTDSIFHIKVQDIHQDGHWFPMYPSKYPIQGWLWKSCEGDQIHQRYPESVAHTKFRHPECHQILGWCVLLCAPKLQGAHRSNCSHGTCVDNGAIAKEINKWEELNRSQDIWIRRRPAIVPVFNILHWW